jgi:hypothetical protein
MGKSQETQQLAVEMSGKWGFGGYRPHYGFFLRRTPQQAAEFFTCRNNSVYGVEAGLPPHIHHTLLWANMLFNILLKYIAANSAIICIA